MFLCNECGNFTDSDYVICHEDPKDDLELICDDCYLDIYDEED